MRTTLVYIKCLRWLMFKTNYGEPRVGSLNLHFEIGRLIVENFSLCTINPDHFDEKPMPIITRYCFQGREPQGKRLIEAVRLAHSHTESRHRSIASLRSKGGIESA